MFAMFYNIFIGTHHTCSCGTYHCCILTGPLRTEEVSEGTSEDALPPKLLTPPSHKSNVL